MFVWDAVKQIKKMESVQDDFSINGHKKILVDKLVEREQATPWQYCKDTILCLTLKIVSKNNLSGKKINLFYRTAKFSISLVNVCISTLVLGKVFLLWENTYTVPSWGL